MQRMTGSLQMRRIALQGGDRLFSVYEIPQGLFALESKIWIITESDRSYTTVLFPSEY